MKILISGGGIAGLTCAYWLQRHGHQPIVIEKAKQVRTDGYLIDFAGTGWDVANLMNLIPALQQKELPVPSVLFKNGADETVSSIDMDTFKEVMGITGKFMALNRADLQELLYEEIKNEVEVRFGCTIEAVSQNEKAVMVTFSDGRSETFDLLIGADGIHSHSRKLAFGPEQQFATYLGYQVATCILPNNGMSLEDGLVTYNEPNRQANLYRLNNDELLAYFIFKSDDDGFIPQPKRKAVLQKQYAGAAWRVPEMLSLLKAETPIFMDSVTQIIMPRWHNGRIALVGDAAYCLTLISGQGASLAMGGAYFLAEALQQTPDHQTAFAHYENRLRTHVEKTQEKARRFAPKFVPGSPFQIWVNNTLTKFLRLSFVARLVGKQFNVQSLLDTETAVSK